MADQLQFRGGTTSEVSAASVASREIIIDTQTTQIAVGTSKKKTVMEESNGDVEIGGGSIELKADGSAEFASGRFAIAAGGKITQNKSAGSTSPSIDLQTDGTSVFQVLPSGYTKIGGGVIELKADGSAEFDGSVSIGGTAAANTIDEYEEGTFTPSITSSNGTDPTQSYAIQSATYVRIGKLCSVRVNVRFTSSGITAGTGNMVVNLPFNVSGYPAGTVGIANYFTADPPVVVQGSNGNSFVSVKKDFANTSCTCDTITNNTQLTFSLVYQIN